MEERLWIKIGADINAEQLISCLKSFSVQAEVLKHIKQHDKTISLVKISPQFNSKLRDQINAGKARIGEAVVSIAEQSDILFYDREPNFKRHLNDPQKKKVFPSYTDYYPNLKRPQTWINQRKALQVKQILDFTTKNKETLHSQLLFQNQIAAQNLQHINALKKQLKEKLTKIYRKQENQPPQPDKQLQQLLRRKESREIIKKLILESIP